jgi:hypothetical protein
MSLVWTYHFEIPRKTSCWMQTVNSSWDHSRDIPAGSQLASLPFSEFLYSHHPHLNPSQPPVLQTTVSICEDVYF